MKLFQKPTIGIALSGGAERGLAHIGALKKLHHAKIEPDYLAGTSIGALVGAAYALHRNTDYLEEFLYKIGWKDYLATFTEICWKERAIKGEYVKKYLQKEFGNKRFADLKIPFTCVSTDVVSGKTIVHQKGKVIDAIRSSISIPRIFTPVPQAHRLLVDGGVSCPLPTQIVRNMGADYVIGVNLNDMAYLKSSREKRMASPMIASFNVVIHQMSLQNEQYADYMIRPRVDDMNVFWLASNKKIRLGIKRGENAARRHIPQIKNDLVRRQYGVLGEVYTMHKSSKKRYLNKSFGKLIEKAKDTAQTIKALRNNNKIPINA